MNLPDLILKTLQIGKAPLKSYSNRDKNIFSGLVEEEQTVNLTVPLRNPYVRRKLDIKQFENVKSFGQDVTVTFHDWEWRGGNNSKLIKKES